jgi:hypothetical protein
VPVGALALGALAFFFLRRQRLAKKQAGEAPAVDGGLQLDPPLPPHGFKCCKGVEKLRGAGISEGEEK